MTLTQTIKVNSAFFVPYSLFLLAGSAVLVLFGKTDIHLFINIHHAILFDYFFRYWTLIGLGWLIFPVVFWLSFIRLRYVIIAVAAFIISAAINDTIKQIVNAPRPAEYFGELHRSLYLIPGVTVYHWDSFPSGHSTTAFCLFCMAALVARSNLWKATWFVVALLVAYSRMYLSEHFLIDVYTGSIVGVLSTVICYNMAMKMHWLDKFPAMDKPLFRL